MTAVNVGRASFIYTATVHNKSSLMTPSSRSGFSNFKYRRTSFLSAPNESTHADLAYSLQTRRLCFTVCHRFKQPQWRKTKSSILHCAKKKKKKKSRRSSNNEPRNRTSCQLLTHLNKEEEEETKQVVLVGLRRNAEMNLERESCRNIWERCEHQTQQLLLLLLPLPLWTGNSW